MEGKRRGFALGTIFKSRGKSETGEHLHTGVTTQMEDVHILPRLWDSNCFLVKRNKDIVDVALGPSASSR